MANVMDRACYMAIMARLSVLFVTDKALLFLLRVNRLTMQNVLIIMDVNCLFEKERALRHASVDAQCFLMLRDIDNINIL